MSGCLHSKQTSPGIKTPPTPIRPLFQLPSSLTTVDYSSSFPSCSYPNSSMLCFIYSCTVQFVVELHLCSNTEFTFLSPIIHFTLWNQSFWESLDLILFNTVLFPFFSLLQSYVAAAVVSAGETNWSSSKLLFEPKSNK